MNIIFTLTLLIYFFVSTKSSLSLPDEIMETVEGSQEPISTINEPQKNLLWLKTLNPYYINLGKRGNTRRNDVFKAEDFRLGIVLCFFKMHLIFLAA